MTKKERNKEFYHKNKEYFQEYYQKVKEKRTIENKERYWNDPEYRYRVRQTSIKSYHKRK